MYTGIRLLLLIHPFIVITPPANFVCGGVYCFRLELLAFVTFLNAVKSLCAHCLFNQWPEFYQTSTDTSLGRGKEVIRFW